METQEMHFALSICKRINWRIHNQPTVSADKPFMDHFDKKTPTSISILD